MIKWHYFSRFLKLCLFGFWISCFMGLGNSANAIQSEWFVPVWWTVVDNNSDPNFSNYVLSRWKMFSTYNHAIKYKQLFALDNYTFWFWHQNWLYLFDWARYNCSTRYVQWFIDTIEICPEIINWTWFSYSDCTDTIDFDPSFVSNFVNNLNNSDWVYYYRYKQWELDLCRHLYYSNYLCFSSSESHSTICMHAWHDWYSNTNWWLTWSLALPDSTNYSSIDESLLYSPPLYWEIEWSSMTWNQAWVNGDVMYWTCSKDSARKWYEFNWFSTRLCYWWLDDFSTEWWVLPIAWQWLDIQRIYDNTKSLRAYGATWTDMTYWHWLHYWRSVYESYTRSDSFQTSPFDWVPKVLLSLLWFIDVYWIQYTDDHIINYCDLAIYTADLNSQYTWMYSDTICNASLIALADQQVSSILWKDPIVWSSWDWITNRPELNSWSSSTWSSSWYQDWLSFENWFFNLLKSSFKYPTWSWNPALPNFIVISMLWIILFRFLMH